MTDQDKVLSRAVELCRRYANNLSELQNGKEVALECAALIDEYRQQVLTTTENGEEPCQEIPAFIVVPDV